MVMLGTRKGFTFALKAAALALYGSGVLQLDQLLAVKTLSPHRLPAG